MPEIGVQTFVSEFLSASPRNRKERGKSERKRSSKENCSEELPPLFRSARLFLRAERERERERVLLLLLLLFSTLSLSLSFPDVCFRAHALSGKKCSVVFTRHAEKGASGWLTGLWHYNLLWNQVIWDRHDLNCILYWTRFRQCSIHDSRDSNSAVAFLNWFRPKTQSCHSMCFQINTVRKTGHLFRMQV